MANEVALTRIQYGAERDPTTRRTISAGKTVEPGQKLPSDFDGDVEALRATGAVGDPAELLIFAASTSQVLQSEDYPTFVEGVPQPVPVNTPEPTDDELEVVLRARTDQVSRAEGEDPRKVVEKERKARNDALEKSAKEAAKEAEKEAK